MLDLVNCPQWNGDNQEQWEKERNEIVCVFVRECENGWGGRRLCIGRKRCSDQIRSGSGQKSVEMRGGEAEPVGDVA